MVDDLNIEKNQQQRVCEILCEKIKLPIISQAIKNLETQIPPTINFHTVEHTMDVLHESILFALEDNLSEHDRDLLLVAAAYHDMGYIVAMRNNEPMGAKMAAEAMSKYGYDINSIATVQKMIIDTAIHITESDLMQLTDDRLAGYLLDADLSNFGRSDFMEKRKLIFHDLGLSNWKEYSQESLQFIKNHKWKTPAGYKLRENQRVENIKLLKQTLSSSV